MFLLFCFRANPLRIIGLSFFSLSILLISIGIGICIVWMRFSSDNRSRPGSPIKPPFQKDIAKESIHTTEPSAEEYELGMGNVRSFLLYFCIFLMCHLLFKLIHFFREFVMTFKHQHSGRLNADCNNHKDFFINGS